MPIPAHLAFDERLRLFELARSLQWASSPAKWAAFWRGTTFLAAAANLKGGNIHAVDTWKNDAMPGETTADTFEQFTRRAPCGSGSARTAACPAR